MRRFQRQYRGERLKNAARCVKTPNCLEQIQQRQFRSRCPAPYWETADGQQFSNRLTATVAVKGMLLKDHPATACDIAPQWRKAAEQFEQIEQGSPPADPDETLELLEARKMLYRIFEVLGLWRNATVASVQKPARRA